MAYKTIRNIQRSFLWNGPSKKSKWALLKWIDICKPKMEGGLGLRDPEILSKAVAAKIWWRWVENPKSLWGTLWKAKYTTQIRDKDLIRLTGATQGSQIWNKAWENRHIVQQHSFWEVHQGNTALFWEDAWQQLPTLEHPDWNTLKRAMQEEGKITVADYWQPASEATIWQKWIAREQWHTPAGPRNVDPFLQDLDKRRILRSNKEDILRWGSNPKGTFNLKEAYKLLAASLDQKSDHRWQTLWSRGTWTKITLFSWLVLHNRALTWDNLQK